MTTDAPQRACPQCRTPLDESFLDASGPKRCPFCDAELPDEELPTTLEVPPPGSRIETVETSDERCVWHIPPGGKKARSIGCFAFLWTAITAIVSGMFVGVGLANKGNDGPPLYFIVPFFGLFWAVGLGMIYWWMRMKFTRLFILLEPGRLVVQRNFLGRKWMTATELGPDSRADLVEAYSENDRPVYTVAVYGTDRTEKFGTALTREEKEWFVRVINGFLTGEMVSPSIADEEGSLVSLEKTVPFDDLAPTDVPPDSPVVIDEARPGRLAFHLTSVGPGGRRAAWIVGAIGLLPLGMSLFVASLAFRGPKPDVVFDVLMPLLFALFFAAFAGIPLLIALFLLRGRISIELDEQSLYGRWGLGPIAFRKRYPLSSIRDIVVAQSRLRGSTPSTRKSATKGSGTMATLVLKDGNTIPLTLLHDLETAKTVAGLVRRFLRQTGQRSEP